MFSDKLEFLRRLAAEVNPFGERERIATVYPTYAYRSPASQGEWTIPLRVWLHKPRRIRLDDQMLGYFVNGLLDEDEDEAAEARSGAPHRPEELTAAELTRLRHCLADFVADDDSGESVTVRFDEDEEGTSYPLSRQTDLNGLIFEDLKLPDEKVRRLLERQGAAAGDQWLRLRAESNGVEGLGRVRVMMEARGLSIVSDVDDTIKVTEVPAGKKIVLRNTFLREYEYVPEMLARYGRVGQTYPGYDGVAFHYVSGSPWQMYRLLAEFLIESSGFPAGTFHMKSMRKNILDPDSWRDIKNFIAGREATLEQKLHQIKTLMRTLPERDFVLIGDSGERDPEVFRAIRDDKDLGPRVKEIIIRDVVADRFEGMTVLEADPVRPGVSKYE
ncbi:MAG: phosphatidate phosphatase App1 family protein [Pyrinomonadaceae bacterium]